MKVHRHELTFLLDWAYQKGRQKEAESMAQASAYGELLAEYDRYRQSKDDEGVKL